MFDLCVCVKSGREGGREECEGKGKGRGLELPERDALVGLDGRGRDKPSFFRLFFVRKEPSR